MISNLLLEDILQLLSEYGRPAVSQAAVSATPGYRAAGQWHVEVSIRTHGIGECPTPELNELQLKHRAWVPARCIGVSKNPTDAARECLRKCEELLEGPMGGIYVKVSVNDCVAAEKLSRTDKEMAEYAQRRIQPETVDQP